jgi:two-component system LytT family response regulator
MKLLVVDDEARARESILHALRLYAPDVQHILEAGSLREALQCLETERPDGVLLDIQLPDGNGFALVPRLRELGIPVIFVTAFEAYAIRAFRVAALSYLLKPVDPDELSLALGQLRERQRERHLDERLNLLLQGIPANETPRQIALRTHDSIHVVDTSQILYCEADRNYTTFHFEHRSALLVSGSIGEYEEMLGQSAFLRIHQSFLVSKQRIERFDRADGGWLVLHSGQRLPVSSRKKDALLHYLQTLR